ncbi:MAG: hypothetical protein AAF249_16945 [Pseudomonadota bacterium]
MMSAAQDPKPHLFIRLAKWLGLPLVGGFAFGFVIATADSTYGWGFDQMLTSASAQGSIGASNGVAFVLGGLLILVSFVVGAGSLVPAYGIKAKMFEDRQDWEDQRGLHLMSALGCFAWGALMVLLALVEPLALPVAAPLMASLALLALILVYSCWQIVRAFDELWHDLSRAMCTWAFYGAFVIGGGWSVLAHLGLAPVLMPLDWISLLTILSLVGSIIANGQRGLLTDKL